MIFPAALLRFHRRNCAEITNYAIPLHTTFLFLSVRMNMKYVGMIITENSPFGEKLSKSLGPLARTSAGILLQFYENLASRRLLISSHFEKLIFNRQMA